MWLCACVCGKSEEKLHFAVKIVVCTHTVPKLQKKRPKRSQSECQKSISPPQIHDNVEQEAIVRQFSTNK